jgi:hypothetical protein
MKPIEYRARVEIEDDAPAEAEEYARQKLREKILNDHDYQLEVIKDIKKIRDYVQSSLVGYIGYILKNRHKKIIEEDLIGYIDYILKIRNEQLKRNQKN